MGIELNRRALALRPLRLSHSRYALRSLARKENVGNRHKFAVWPIDGHDFMAVRIIHQALQMYVEHSIPNEKSRAAYLDAIKCWPASPSVQAIIDATQMYLDDKEEYSIKFSLPSEGRHFVDGMSQSEIMDMLGYW